MSKKNATIYDVAKLASVSLATASRVMNGIDKVAPDTKQRVLNAIKELNYKPNTIAIELASRKTTNIAIIVPELNYTYISNVVAGLMEEANNYGYDCLIFTTKGSKDEIKKVMTKVLSTRPNGIVIFNDSLTEDELMDLVQFDIPLVTLGMDLKSISSVSWHYKAQIVDLVNEALARNKEIYFIKVEGGGKIEERILQGIKQAYLENNREFTNIIEVKDSHTKTYNTRDGITLAALNAALDSNLKVPDDFEFMAMIGTKYSELSRPKLSSFSIDMKGLGREGIKVLNELIEHNNGEIITKKLMFNYVKRGSTL